MNKEEAKAYVGQRNAEALLQRIKDMEAVMTVMYDNMVQQNATIQNLTAQLTAMQTAQNAARVLSIGHGPSVR